MDTHIALVHIVAVAGFDGMPAVVVAVQVVVEYNLLETVAVVDNFHTLSDQSKR